MATINRHPNPINNPAIEVLNRRPQQSLREMLDTLTHGEMALAYTAAPSAGRWASRQGLVDLAKECFTLAHAAQIYYKRMGK